MHTCTICGYALHGARALWTTCQTCQDRITRQLTEIEQMWPLLSECLEPVRRGSGQRVSGTAAPALPIDGRILDLIGPMGVPTRLYHRYADLALARNVRPAHMSPGADHRVALALWGIRKHLPWGVQGADLSELSRELGKMSDELQMTTGGVDTPTVACPAELPDGGRCTGKMRYDHARGTAYCRACRTELNPGEWLGYWVKLNDAA
ncbi:hypothetical protein ACGFNY_45465 [Streptomyces chartreusis]|uniref:hypothetical protein n=1 Tax=Streptomyces chartreusis TaxID=1969 RepID=UPI00371CB3F2